MAGPGGPVGPVQTEPHKTVLERRQAYEKRNPDVFFSIRREGSRWLTDVSAPNEATVSYENAGKMMDELEAAERGKAS
jgi:hypothetical protein